MHGCQASNGAALASLASPHGHPLWPPHLTSWGWPSPLHPQPHLTSCAPLHALPHLMATSCAAPSPHLMRTPSRPPHLTSWPTPLPCLMGTPLRPPHLTYCAPLCAPLPTPHEPTRRPPTLTSWPCLAHPSPHLMGPPHLTSWPSPLQPLPYLTSWAHLCLPPFLTSYTAESAPSTMANTMMRIQPMVTRKPSPHVFTSRGL